MEGEEGEEDGEGETEGGGGGGDGDGMSSINRLKSPNELLLKPSWTRHHFSVSLVSSLSSAAPYHTHLRAAHHNNVILRARLKGKQQPALCSSPGAERAVVVLRLKYQVPIRLRVDTNLRIIIRATGIYRNRCALLPSLPTSLYMLHNLKCIIRLTVDTPGNRKNTSGPPPRETVLVYPVETPETEYGILVMTKAELGPFPAV